ncbi:hypothetical protein D8T39_21390 [Vibrio vulnificus]|nr:hypothetical protein D8T56_22270 [Vibrio vulnificus]RZQ06392.1 hypothetical protein D8T39_21390 [Vibrio vulnificus]RZQ25708.1 hypothetical protein D8T42_21745 [Vibrio vulnificus]RZQ72601.1 hypothetical protein D8T31_21965 [Vibrio vulnificus]
MFNEFKFSKETDFELSRQHQRNDFSPRNHPRQRSSANEIAQKLETVNDVGNALTAHLVPPERT